MAHTSVPELVSNYSPSAWRLTQYVYDCMLSARVGHMKKKILILLLWNPVYPMKEYAILMSGSLISKSGKKLVV